MKKTIWFCVLLVFLLLPLIGCSQNNSNPANESNDKDYRNTYFSVDGENVHIEVRNGFISITSNSMQFVGGELVFTTDPPSDVKDYRTEFFYFNDGSEVTIRTFTLDNQTSEVATIQPNLGSSTLEFEYRADIMENILESFHFRLSGTLMNGDTFEHDITMNVSEITRDMLGDYKPMIFVNDKLYGETNEVVNDLPEEAFILGFVQTLLPPHVPMTRTNTTSNRLPLGSDIFSIPNDSSKIYAQLPDGRYSIYEEIE